MAIEPGGAVQLLREGTAHYHAGRLDRAGHLYQQALLLDPACADALHLLGVVALARQDYDTAARHIRRAIEFRSDSPIYHSNLGVVYRSLQRTAEAIDVLRKAVQLDPTSAGIRYNLANALKDAGQFADASDVYRESLDRDPQNAEAWTCLGDALRELGRLDESHFCHNRAVAIAPRLAAAHYNLGLTHKDEGDWPAAAQCFRHAASNEPDFFDAYVNLGNVYEDLGDFPRACDSFDRALQLRPDSAIARFNRSLTLLRQGRLESGWSEYEARWLHNGKSRRFFEPEWDGLSDRGKTVLAYSEQGIGDEIMFASCVPEVIERTGQCLLECEPRLVALFARSFPSARVFPRAGEVNPAAMQSLPPWDAQVAAGSLPRRLRPMFESFPLHRGYLKADPLVTEAWRARFDRLPAGLVVGISWRGGNDPTIRRRRSTTLAQWAPLFRVPGVAFVNLQYGDCDVELEQCREELGVTIHDWDESDALCDLDGFAAQVAAVDLVISVDNATVHLAGALNVPTWVLLHFACDWRWFTGRDDSPWYPSLRLFRQVTSGRSSAGDWDPVFERAASALGALAMTRADDERRQADRLHHQGRAAEAIRHYERSLALRPGDAETLNDLGVAWRDVGRRDFASAAYKRALELDPQSANIWFNLGNVHREENRLDESIDCYQRAKAFAPHDHRIRINLSVALRDRRRLPEAAQCLDQVLRANPELPEARFDLSLIQLLRGDFARGWDGYEWRLRDRADARRLPTVPWNGTSLADRTILILCEQGIGDQVMFASCLEAVANDAGRCFVECDRRLVPLFARSFPKVVPIARSTDPAAVPDVGSCDFVSHLGSLPQFSRRQITDFPTRIGYLKPAPDLVAKWRSRLSRLGGALKVGIAWHGGKDVPTQKQRSIAPDLWQPVLQVPGVRFVNLQHGANAAAGARMSARFGISLDDGSDCDPLNDLDDFTAKIAALDLVISADNSTVHLAAAAGRPVWTLLPFSSDWRWMLEIDTTPWYPTMRLLRCSTPDGWPEVLKRAARLLATEVFARG